MIHSIDVNLLSSKKLVKSAKKLTEVSVPIRYNECIIHEAG